MFENMGNIVPIQSSTKVGFIMSKECFVLEKIGEQYLMFSNTENGLVLDKGSKTINEMLLEGLVCVQSVREFIIKL